MAAGKKTKIRYDNTDTPEIVISEPILRNILKDWQGRWENNYKIKVSKIEKISWLLSLLGIVFTLWITYFTAIFQNRDGSENVFAKAVLFVLAIILTVALIGLLIVAVKAYRAKEEILEIEELIKDIEKRTD